MSKRQNISFRVVSYTDAAGKYSAEAFRSGNEDNFYVDDDLTDDTTNRVDQDEVLQLGEFGMLMVVADRKAQTDCIQNWVNVHIADLLQSRSHWLLYL